LLFQFVNGIWLLNVGMGAARGGGKSALGRFARGRLEQVRRLRKSAAFLPPSSSCGLPNQSHTSSVARVLGFRDSQTSVPPNDAKFGIAVLGAKCTSRPSGGMDGSKNVALRSDRQAGGGTGGCGPSLGGRLRRSAMNWSNSARSLAKRSRSRNSLNSRCSSSSRLSVSAR
jgi:hypothetical protein